MLPLLWFARGGQVGRQLRSAKHAAEDGVSAGRHLFSEELARICDFALSVNIVGAYGLLNNYSAINAVLFTVLCLRGFVAVCSSLYTSMDRIISYAYEVIIASRILMRERHYESQNRRRYGISATKYEQVDHFSSAI